MSPEESRSFERELAGDSQLEEEFSEVSAAYRMIGDQLRKRDEEAFSSAMNAAMKRPGTDESPRKKRHGRWCLLFLGVAASLTVLISIFGPGRNTEKIYATWYKPSEDPVISTINEETRGKADHAVAKLWQEGDYKQCKKITSHILSEDSENQFAMLFCLLSSMELDKAEAQPDWMKVVETSPGHPLEQALAWYHALALIKADEASEAALLLTYLEELPGPYKRDAHKLKKKLKK